MSDAATTSSLAPSPLAQAVLARVLNGRRLARAAALQARRLLVRCGDPLVEIDVAGARLLAPLSHDLPLYRQRFVHYDTALPRLAAYLLAASGNPLAIVDVGANIGDSAAALLALPGSTVLAIEGNERFQRLLVANGKQWPGRLTPVQCFLGEKDATLAAAIEARRGTGTLRLGSGTTSVRTLAGLIEEHAAFRRAGLVKIDTDGFDVAILRGAAAWLAEAQPVLFFEYDPHFWRPITPDGARIFRELAGLGYGPLLVYDNFGWLAWSGSVDDRRRLEELDAWLSGRGSDIYVDICAFPAAEKASFEQFRGAELRHFAAVLTPPQQGHLRVVPQTSPAARPRLHSSR